ncbi:MAG: PGF-pre-PGF domain-containing protein [Nanoarchaeota archaeon]|nr:PGF-pre-PGF domain-containing protein [Nanoarchaeota archaeon]
MKNKKLFLWFLVVLSVALLVLALGNTTITPDDIKFGTGIGTGPKTFQASNVSANISGTTNLTVSIRGNASFFVNTSIFWTFAFDDTEAAANGTIMATTTINNNSRNTTLFTTSFDTTILPDGVYNVSVAVYNLSDLGDPFSYQQTINTTSFNITVDNTKPNATIMLSYLNTTAGATGAAGATGPASINFSRDNIIPSGGNITFNVTVLEQLSGVNSVFFEFFSLRNSTRFNITAEKTAIPNTVLGNRSGVYSAVYNISNLPGGTWELRAYTTDQSGNINITPPVTFGVSGQVNVSINSTSELFYSAKSGNQTFVVSMTNATGIFQGSGTNSSTITNVLLVFDRVSDTNDVNISLIGNGKDKNTSAGNNSFLQGINIDLSPTNGIVNFTAGINFSNLTEGRYQLRVFAEDGFGNFNYTENITVIVDKTNPSVSVSCSPAEPQVGDTVTCTCTASDALAGVKGAVKFSGTGLSTDTTTADSVGGKTSTECAATDKSGNRGTKTGTFTVVEATDGGSGTGGSGGGSSSGSSGTFGQRSWNSLNAGEVAVVDVTDKSVGVTKVSFGVTQTSYGGWVRVSKRDNAPLTAEAFTKKMYKVVEVTTSTALKESDLTNRKIEFRVEKSWLQSSGLSASDVTMYRLVNNEWVALAVTAGQDDGTNVHYSATTPGFSFFLIGEKGQAGTSAPAEEGAAGEQAPGTAPGEEGAMEGGDAAAKGGMSTATIVVIVLVVLAAGAAVWYFFGRGKEE